MNQFLDKLGTKKNFIGLLSLLLIMGVIAIFAIELPKRSFEIENQAFKYKKVDQGVHYFEDQSGNVLTAYRQGLNPRITSYYDAVLITYKEELLFQEITYEEDEPYHLYLDNALIYKSDLMDVKYTESTFVLLPIENDGLYIEDALYYRTLVHHVMSRIEYLNQNAILNKMMMLVFTSVLGLICLLFPKKLWVLQHFLSVRKDEPTLFFLVTTRLMGLIFFLLGINGILL